MLGRRLFVLAGLFAPVAASGSVGTVTEADAGRAMSVGGVGDMTANKSAIAKIFSKASTDREMKEDARIRQVKLMPISIRTKKSWSEAFKSHVYLQHERELATSRWWMAETDDERIALLIKSGYGHLLKGVK